MYRLYIKEDLINTKIAKSYISGRVQSPAVAILNTFKNGIINNHDESNPSTFQGGKVKTEKKLDKKSIGKLKDETRFFNLISEIIGKDYLLSKSIGKPINSSHVFLSNNFKDYNFDENLNQIYIEILTALNSNFKFSSNSLSHHIDGLILNHPILENRIIEFDEEQHFTPARKNTLSILKQHLADCYFTHFENICNDLNYLNNNVLKSTELKKT